jgi:hypothetical protein
MKHQFEQSGALKMLTAEELATADEHSSVIVLDRGMAEDGKTYWAYVAVKPSQYGAFMRASAARQTIRLSDYGKILKWGMGTEVPADIQEAMRREHGFDEKYMSRLAAEVKQAQAEFLKTQDDSRIANIVSMLKKQTPNGSAAAPPPKSAVATKAPVANKGTGAKKTVPPKKAPPKPKSFWARIFGK